jgi:hypothetical protein
MTVEIESWREFGLRLSMAETDFRSKMLLACTAGTY